MLQAVEAGAGLWRLSVPATTPPRYAVASGVRCVPVNELARIAQPQAGYVIVGAGKTGMDACIWLLQSGAELVLDWAEFRYPGLFRSQTTTLTRGRPGRTSGRAGLDGHQAVAAWTETTVNAAELGALVTV